MEVKQKENISETGQTEREDIGCAHQKLVRNES